MQATQIARPNLRLAAFWTVLGAIGTLAGFPYLVTLNASAAPPPLPLPALAAIATVQSAIVLFATSWLGLRLGQSVGLDSPLARAVINDKQRPPVSQSGLILAVSSGVMGGALILFLVQLFQPFLPETPQAATLQIALWKRALASLYGGVVEELLLRLFLMTFIAWLLWKAGLRTNDRPSNWAMGIAIALSALLFGVGHFPAAAAIWPLTAIVITRTLLLNSLMGIVFGVLYWQWGLEYAMISHFWADVVLHVIGGS